ncbi:MAG: hypothetical protein KAU17_10385 [Spirochaetales bacterium]|nr:hypothetical protein [Spirochaetales bacterium]
MKDKGKKMLPRHAAGSMELKGGTGMITGMISCGDFLEIYKRDKTFRVRSPENIDPEETNPKALWVTSKADDVGTENKIIARILFQGHEIVKAACFDEEINKEAVTQTLHKCKETLISCEKIYNNISKQIEYIIDEIKSEGIERDNQGRGLNPFPQVIDLENECGSFLVLVNRAIKTICELPILFLPLERVDYNFDFLGKRLRKHFCTDTNLTRFVFSNAKSIRYLIDLRNSNEHPGNKKTIIQNFHVLPDSNIQVPIWQVTGYPPMPIQEEMKAIIDFLIEIAEVMLINLVMATVSKKYPFIIEKNAEADINPDNPQLYRLSIDIRKLNIRPKNI